LKTQNKFREWLADKVLGFYFWLAEMTEQEYWDRANMFRPTPRVLDFAICAPELHRQLDEQGFRYCGYCSKPLSQ